MDQGKKVIVAGCVPQGKPDAEYIKGLSVIGVQQIDRVVEVVEETLKGSFTKDNNDILFLKHIHHNQFVNICSHFNLIILRKSSQTVWSKKSHSQ